LIQVRQLCQVAAPLAFEGVVVPVGRTALTILKRLGKNKKVCECKARWNSRV